MAGSSGSGVIIPLVAAVAAAMSAIYANRANEISAQALEQANEAAEVVMSLRLDARTRDAQGIIVDAIGDGIRACIEYAIGTRGEIGNLVRKEEHVVESLDQKNLLDDCLIESGVSIPVKYSDRPGVVDVGKEHSTRVAIRVIKLIEGLESGIDQMNTGHLNACNSYDALRTFITWNGLVGDVKSFRDKAELNNSTAFGNTI